MRTTVYARLFDRLADLIPSLQSARAGAVFCALRESLTTWPCIATSRPPRVTCA